MDVVPSDTESHRGDNWRGNEEGSKIEQKVATFNVKSLVGYEDEENDCDVVNNYGKNIFL